MFLQLSGPTMSPINAYDPTMRLEGEGQKKKGDSIDESITLGPNLSTVLYY